MIVLLHHHPDKLLSEQGTNTKDQKYDADTQCDYIVCGLGVHAAQHNMIAVNGQDKYPGIDRQCKRIRCVIGDTVMVGP